MCNNVTLMSIVPAVKLHTMQHYVSHTQTHTHTHTQLKPCTICTSRVKHNTIVHAKVHVQCHVQWNLLNSNTHGTKIKVQLSSTYRICYT